MSVSLRARKSSTRGIEQDHRAGLDGAVRHAETYTSQVVHQSSSAHSSAATTDQVIVCVSVVNNMKARRHSMQRWACSRWTVSVPRRGNRQPSDSRFARAHARVCCSEAHAASHESRHIAAECFRCRNFGSQRAAVVPALHAGAEAALASTRQSPLRPASQAAPTKSYISFTTD